MHETNFVMPELLIKELWFLSTCCSVTSRVAARSARSAELRYFCVSNVFSRVNICRPEKEEKYVIYNKKMKIETLDIVV